MSEESQASFPKKRKLSKSKEEWKVANSKGFRAVGKGRNYTVSVALPGAQSRELRTYLAGQIARTAAVFSVDEIIVFDDKSSTASSRSNQNEDGDSGGAGGRRKFSDGNTFLAKLLQYLETPQYLRKDLFPRHRDLQFAGLLNPVDAPHHLRRDEECLWREGVVKEVPGKEVSNLVNLGFLADGKIDRKLPPGTRVTVKLENKGQVPKGSKRVRGKAVSPSEPRTSAGLYWGYTVRMASSLAEVWSGCEYPGGYDYSIGTSENGDIRLDDASYALPPFKHLLIVFGGVSGLETAVEDTEDMNIPASRTSYLFDAYVNTCPNQGSRTIRTEEAFLITMSLLRPKIVNQNNK
eukprot:CAMPEP_0184011978 /NCGR_PEP_ID=MMETSP0954-20121128/4128_1 /TAXON_ID=627963 /ORGANISM="Aplanochytrium sp, Strain PBS07" /LENGTH=349 /DNA_ID=CAMNT_0026291857 /DNA_START=94 /DNA_END=1143 /DNA_ORIENTATION=-